MLAAAVFGAGLAVTGQNLLTLVVGAALWFASLPLLRWMAKADPMITLAYRRHLRYRGYLPAALSSVSERVMLALKHFRDTHAGLADLLNYAALIDDGVVQGKDGSRLSNV